MLNQMDMGNHIIERQKMTKIELLRMFDDCELEETGRRILLAKNGNRMEKVFYKYKPLKKWKKTYMYTISTPLETDWFIHDDYKNVFDRFNVLNGDE